MPALFARVSCCGLLGTALLLFHCDLQTPAEREEASRTGTGAPEPGEQQEAAYPTYAIPIGAQVEICHTDGEGANLRTGPSSNYLVQDCLADGTKGQAKKQSGNWLQLEVGARIGWVYGKYLCLISVAPSPDAGVPAMDAQSPKPDAGATPSKVIEVSRDGIINACQAFVGFSYWYGSAQFEVGSKEYGQCYSLSSHSGSNGADCSGFASKVWQLPEAMPFNKNLHPFSTYSFYYDKTHWDHISRGEMKKADALVYRSGDSGHIVIYESGDVWGQDWVYEAQNCSAGIIHHLSTLGSSYQARRRHDL
jgi:hypothetical protein